jgi:hypothetical protein
MKTFGEARRSSSVRQRDARTRAANPGEPAVSGVERPRSAERCHSGRERVADGLERCGVPAFEVVAEGMGTTGCQHLACRLVNEDCAHVEEHGRPTRLPHSGKEAARPRGPAVEVARLGQVVDDGVVLDPEDARSGVRIGERSRERLPEVPLDEVALGVVLALADDRPLLADDELRAAAQDAARLVDDRIL